MIPKLAYQLILHEGIRFKPYRDSVGKLTIGIGRNLDDKGITREEALYLFENDVKEKTAELDRYLPWWRKLDEVRQRVLLDMCFNMGIGDERRGLRSFKNTLSAIEDGLYEEAADLMLKSKWAKQVKGRARRLARMMRTGKDFDAPE